MPIISLYVDDLIVTGNSAEMSKFFKESKKKTCDMSDLGQMRHFLGIEVVQDQQGIFICQHKYARDILERFGMTENNSVGSPIVPGSVSGGDCGKA